MPFGIIGDILGIGGSDSEAEANNDVDVSVTSAPVINIELDDLAGQIEGVGTGLNSGLMSFASTLGFVGLVGIAALSFGRR